MTYNLTQHFLITSTLAAALVLGACADTPTDTAAMIDKAAIDIGLLQQGGAQTNDFTTPEGFVQGDKLIAYEGPGWESDKVAYRLYLDGRNAIDIFGKRTPELVLSGVGRGEDYHAMAAWGMDILKVGASVGVGGVGVYDDGALRQIGDASAYRAQVIEDGLDSATLRVSHINSQACGGDMDMDYRIEAGSRLTHVSVNSDCALPIGTGLVIHPNTTALASNGTEGWQYKARWGVQSLSEDNLGFALFYRAGDAAIVGADNDDDYVVFNSTRPDYAFGAAWSQEGSGITTQPQFEAWLLESVAMLNAKSQ